MGFGIGLGIGLVKGGVRPTLSAPTNISPPSVSGSRVQGATLTCTPGVWSGGEATRQWGRVPVDIAEILVPSAFAPIDGETGLTYVQTADDTFNEDTPGLGYRVVVKESNGGVDVYSANGLQTWVNDTGGEVTWELPASNVLFEAFGGGGQGHTAVTSVTSSGVRHSGGTGGAGGAYAPLSSAGLFVQGAVVRISVSQGNTAIRGDKPGATPSDTNPYTTNLRAGYGSSYYPVGVPGGSGGAAIGGGGGSAAGRVTIGNAGQSGDAGGAGGAAVTTAGSAGNGGHGGTVGHPAGYPGTGRGAGGGGGGSPNGLGGAGVLGEIRAHWPNPTAFAPTSVYKFGDANTVLCVFGGQVTVNNTGPWKINGGDATVTAYTGGTRTVGVHAATAVVTGQYITVPVASSAATNGLGAYVQAGRYLIEAAP